MHSKKQHNLPGTVAIERLFNEASKCSQHEDV